MIQSTFLVDFVILLIFKSSNSPRSTAQLTFHQNIPPRTCRMISLGRNMYDIDGLFRFRSIIFTVPTYSSVPNTPFTVITTCSNSCNILINLMYWWCIFFLILTTLWMNPCHKSVWTDWDKCTKPLGPNESACFLE